MLTNCLSINIANTYIIIITGCFYRLSPISRFRMMKIWLPQNTFFILLFTGRAFIMVKYIIKLVLELQFYLQKPRKQSMWIFWKMKNHCFSVCRKYFCGASKSWYFSPFSTYPYQILQCPQCAVWHNLDTFHALYI